jgi:hypothetical protein
MSAHPEQILYEAVHGRKALHLGGRLEAPHLALALARRLMGDFSSIVRVLVRDVDHRRHQGPAQPPSALRSFAERGATVCGVCARDAPDCAAA